MPWNESPLAYVDVRDAFERALAAKHGIRIRCSNRSEAVNLRSKFNFYRKLNRKENREIYPEGHLMYGTSAFDGLTLRVRKKGEQDDNYLYISPHVVDSMDIEELEEPTVTLVPEK